MDDATINRFVIIHCQAVLKAPLDDAARAIVLQLLAKAESELSTAEQKHDRILTRRRWIF